MAGFSFLDLMLADALAGGLARDAARARERPPPDNVFLIPKNLDAWRQIKEACRKENMVFLVDITDGSSDNCTRVDNVFIDMAREFDGLPFFIVKVGPFGTFDELRKDLGGIQFTPTILIGFYGETLKRVKYEGEAEIRNGLRNGRLKEQVKEFMNMRGKLKLVEHVAEGLAQQVKDEMSERERRIRLEYEQKMKRELAEKEEKSRKEEEDKKRQEEEEQRKKSEKMKRTAEIRREERPQHLEDLLKMDLNSASIRDIKAIMIRMGISPHDCFERADLKRKLKENVPELRMAMERQESSASMSSRGSVSSMGSSIGSTLSDMNNLGDPLAATNATIDDLRSQLSTEEANSRSLRNDKTKLESSLQALRRQVDQKDKELREAKEDMKQMTVRANKAEEQVLKSRNGPPIPKPRTNVMDSDRRVKELETRLLQTRMLYTTNIEDFNVLRVIHGSGEEGMVLSVSCDKLNIPNKDKIYAMKVLTDYFHTQTQTQVRSAFQNEYQVLCQLPPHENVIHMWAFFFDRVNPDVIPEFKAVGSNARTMSLFLLMDQHSMSMKDQLTQLVDNKGPAPVAVLRWFTQLIKALIFLEEYCVVHRDLKLDNLLLNSEGNLVVSDFGNAVLLDQSFTIPFMHGTDRGGNQAHLAPEVLNAKQGPKRSIVYTKQPVWAAGVLAYELAGHPNPFEKGTIDQRGYSIDQVPSLIDTYCKHARYCQPLPRELWPLVQSMLQPEARDRPSLTNCLARLKMIN